MKTSHGSENDYLRTKERVLNSLCFPRLLMKRSCVKNFRTKNKSVRIKIDPGI